MHITGSTPDDVRFRVVVTGSDDGATSKIVSDDRASTVVLTPLFNSVDLWQTDAVPAGVDDASTLTGVPSLEPPKGGVVVRMVTIPPDSEAHAGGADAAAALGEIGGGDSHVEGGTVGLHRTDTIDVITVIDGELYSVLDTGETLLKAGDTLIQRGTTHAWSNRTSAPATFMATMYSASR